MDFDLEMDCDQKVGPSSQDYHQEAKNHLFLKIRDVLSVYSYIIIFMRSTDIIIRINIATQLHFSQQYVRVKERVERNK